MRCIEALSKCGKNIIIILIIITTLKIMENSKNKKYNIDYQALSNHR